MVKQTKVMTRRRKFVEIGIPIIGQKFELIGNSVEDVKGHTIKLDLTRQLKGKGVEVIVKIVEENKKAVAHAVKLRLMPYFINRIMRKRISYVEDSFETSSQDSMLKVKPFLITRKRVSRAVRKALRNKARNWLEDYLDDKKDSEIFQDVLGNKMQRSLSLVLKKTYPLSFCEIRVLEIIRPLKEDEVKKVKKKAKEKKVEDGVIDQLKEIEDEKIKKAEEEIKKVQDKASGKEKEDKDKTEEEIEEVKGEEKKVKKEKVIDGD